MEINYTNSTKTSIEIITNLQQSGHKLTNKDKQMIIDKVYLAIRTSMKWQSNGCDCGQMCCPICGN